MTVAKDSLTFVPKVQISNIPALVQIMAWCRLGDKPLSEPTMVKLLTRICVTRPQWIYRGGGGITTHYGDVTMGTIPSQITSLTIVYSTVYSGADQRKHQSSASLAFVQGIHRGPVNSPQMASNAENVSIWWRHHEISWGKVKWAIGKNGFQQIPGWRFRKHWAQTQPKFHTNRGHKKGLQYIRQNMHTAWTILHFLVDTGHCILYPSGSPHSDIGVIMRFHYKDVTMGVIASQITSNSTVCFTICSRQYQRNIKAPRYWPFERGNHLWPVNPPQF